MSYNFVLKWEVFECGETHVFLARDMACFGYSV